MGHYCRICGETRGNEKFSGKGRRVHVCQDCERIPVEERQALEQETDIFGFLAQSRISKKNVSRLQELAASSNRRVAELASVALEVATVVPHKKRRLRILERERADLLRRLEETGLIDAHGG